MDIIQIAELVGAAVGGGWISHLFSVRSKIRTEKAGADKAEAEVKSDQIENIEKMVEKAYKPIIEDLTTQIQKLQEKVEKLEEIKDKQNERIDELEEENRKLRLAVREVNPDLVPSLRGENGKSAPRSKDGRFVKKTEEQ